MSLHDNLLQPDGTGSVNYGEPPPHQSTYNSNDNDNSSTNNNNKRKSFWSGGGPVALMVIIFMIMIIIAFALFPPIVKKPHTELIYTYISCDVTPNHRCANDTFFITTGPQPTAKNNTTTNSTVIVRGIYDDILNQTGWTSLSISTTLDINSVKLDDIEIMRATGYLEGYLTAARITDGFRNDNATAWGSRPPGAQQALKDWFSLQETYYGSQIEKNAHDTTGKIPLKTKQYWTAVELIQSQEIGLRDGYEARLHELNLPIEFDVLFWLRRPEFGDVLNTIYHNMTKNCWDTSMSQIEMDILMGEEHCSSISKTVLDLVNTASCYPITDNDHIDHIDTNIITAITNMTTFTPIQITKVPIGDNIVCDVSYMLDFVVAHDTWTSFTSLVRVLKKYELNLALYRETHPQSTTTTTRTTTHPTQITQQTIVDDGGLHHHNNNNNNDDTTHTWRLIMTGYPGLLTSYDDFYILPSPEQQLIITETTNTNCAKDLWLKNSPRSISTSLRTLIASLLATNKPSTTDSSWADIYSRENSGTYNNQWMVIDLSLWDPSKVQVEITPRPGVPFEKLKALTKRTNITHTDHYFFAQVVKTGYPEGFYKIAEQMPGTVVSKDVTHIVNNQTYWRSYNRPFSPDVYIAMGFDKSTEIIGDYFSYTDYARAQILQRDLEYKSPTSLLQQQQQQQPSHTSSLSIPFQSSEEIHVINNYNHLAPYPTQNTTSLYDLMKYMRFNDYENDPLSRGCPIYAIAARNDLIPPEGCGKPLSKPNARGQTDVKMGSALAIRQQYPDLQKMGIINPLLTQRAKVIDWGNNDVINQNTTIITTGNHDALFWIIAGPTSEQQNPFTWNDPRWVNFTHYGHPDHFSFEWIQISH